MISTANLEHNFDQMRKFSLPGEGITRLAFSNEDWQARDFVINLMKQEGLMIRIDGFGNVIGRREGINPNADVVLCGSHIDSVPHGGNFDGVLGVLGAIEVVHMMNESDFKNYAPLEVIVFMCEESSRFGVATLGSSAICGSLSIKRMKELKDKDGKSLYDILHMRKLTPENMQNTLNLHRIKASIEMHIEQGKVLESLHKPIGVVTGIAAPTRLKVKLTGKADHSGATPMGMRADALCAAAEIIKEVEKAATDSQKPVVGTVGIVNVQPNVMNVIPGCTELGIDIRSIYSEAKDKVVRHIREYIQEVCKKRGIANKTAVLTDETPVKLDDKVIKVIEESCKENALDYNLMPSGAGHDTMHLAQFVSAGMIFIPCRDGISHNAAEWVDMDQIIKGVSVLYTAVTKLVQKDK